MVYVPKLILVQESDIFEAANQAEDIECCDAVYTEFDLLRARGQAASVRWWLDKAAPGRRRHSIDRSNYRSVVDGVRG